MPTRWGRNRVACSQVLFRLQNPAKVPGFYHVSYAPRSQPFSWYLSRAVHMTRVKGRSKEALETSIADDCAEPPHTRLAADAM